MRLLYLTCVICVLSFGCYAKEQKTKANTNKIILGIGLQYNYPFSSISGKFHFSDKAAAQFTLSPFKVGIYGLNYYSARYIYKLPNYSHTFKDNGNLSVGYGYPYVYGGVGILWRYFSYSFGGGYELILKKQFAISGELNYGLFSYSGTAAVGDFSFGLGLHYHIGKSSKKVQADPYNGSMPRTRGIETDSDDKEQEDGSSEDTQEKKDIENKSNSENSNSKSKSNNKTPSKKASDKSKSKGTTPHKTEQVQKEEEKDDDDANAKTGEITEGTDTVVGEIVDGRGRSFISSDFGINTSQNNYIKNQLSTNNYSGSFSFSRCHDFKFGSNSKRLLFSYGIEARTFNVTYSYIDYLEEKAYYNYHYWFVGVPFFLSYTNTLSSKGFFIQAGLIPSYRAKAYNIKGEQGKIDIYNIDDIFTPLIFSATISAGFAFKGKNRTFLLGPYFHSTLGNLAKEHAVKESILSYGIRVNYLPNIKFKQTKKASV